jgi:hypothetical protein
MSDRQPLLSTSSKRFHAGVHDEDDKNNKRLLLKMYDTYEILVQRKTHINIFIFYSSNFWRRCFGPKDSDEEYPKQSDDANSSEIDSPVGIRQLVCIFILI